MPALLLVLLAGCGTTSDEASLVLRVGPPTDAVTVEAAADVVRARLAALEVPATVTVEADRVSATLPPARPGDRLVTLLTDPGRLRVLGLPIGVEPPQTDVVDPSWEVLLEPSGPVLTVEAPDASGNAALTFTFGDADAERLAAVTKTRVGQYIALVFGDEVIAVPMLRTPLEDGGLTLTLASTDGPSPERRHELAALISSGPLPATLTEDIGG